MCSPSSGYQCSSGLHSTEHRTSLSARPESVLWSEAKGTIPSTLHGRGLVCTCYLCSCGKPRESPTSSPAPTKGVKSGAHLYPSQPKAQQCPSHHDGSWVLETWGQPEALATVGAWGSRVSIPPGSAHQSDESPSRSSSTRAAADSRA